jgi:uncharacterized protein YjbJ (UPF0337 family)
LTKPSGRHTNSGCTRRATYQAGLYETLQFSGKFSKEKEENPMKPSKKDQIKGELHELKGDVKETAGQVTNNPNLETKGQNEKLAGKVQKKVGQIEEVIEK